MRLNRETEFPPPDHEAPDLIETALGIMIGLIAALFVLKLFVTAVPLDDSNRTSCDDLPVISESRHGMLLLIGDNSILIESPHSCTTIHTK